MIPIQQAVGRTIACPLHPGEVATVSHARAPGGNNAGPKPPSIASQWYMVDCPGFGKKLYKAGTMVELAEAAEAKE